MELSKKDLANGREFIVGEWRVDYVVNFFSNDLAHIPAEKFTDGGGNDLTSVKAEFFGDGGVVITENASGALSFGQWEQSDLFEYKWHFDKISGTSLSAPLKEAETLTVFEGDLVFTTGFLTVAIKKTK